MSQHGIQNHYEIKGVILQMQYKTNLQTSYRSP